MDPLIRLFLSMSFTWHGPSLLNHNWIKSSVLASQFAFVRQGHISVCQSATY